MSKYVIDSETLTDIADAIRAKTGDSASMTPLEMPDEIASISGGGATKLTIKCNNPTFGEQWPDFDAIGIKELRLYVYQFTNRQPPNMLANINVETLIVEYAPGLYPSNLRDMFRGGYNAGRSMDGTPPKLKTIKLVNIDTSTISDWFCTFQASNDGVGGVEVIGEINFSSYSSGNPFNGDKFIREIRFTQNTLGVGMTISAASGNEWSDDTWASFANCLKSTSATLTIGSTLQTRLASITGTVDGGVFMLDSGGSVSLSSFITSTKGWTLA